MGRRDREKVRTETELQNDALWRNLKQFQTLLVGLGETSKGMQDMLRSIENDPQVLIGIKQELKEIKEIVGRVETQNKGILNLIRILYEIILDPEKIDRWAKKAQARDIVFGDKKIGQQGSIKQGP